MQVKLTDENVDLMNRVYLKARLFNAEKNLPPPSVTQIVNGLINAYAKAYLAKFDMPNQETVNRHD